MGNFRFAFRENRRIIVLCFLSLAFMIFGIKEIHDARITSLHTQLSNELKEKAEFITRTINPNEINIQSISEDGNEMPHFNRLQNQLKYYHPFINVENVYTLFRREEQVFFGPASYTKPQNAITPDLFKPYIDQVYKTGSIVMISPRNDPGIKYFTVLAPMLDMRTGQVLMVIGLDQDIELFRNAVKKERHRILTSGIWLIILVLLSFLLFYQVKIKPSSQIWVYRYAGVFVVAMLGLTFTVLSAYIFSEIEKTKRREIFTNLAKPHANRISEMLTGFHDNDLMAMVRLFEMNPQASRSEFAFLTQKSYRRFHMAGLGWAPKVLDKDRNTFIENVRQELDHHFNIAYNDPFVGRIASKRKDYYFPLKYVEPYDEIKSALGLDLHSDSLRWRAIKECIRTGLPVFTNKIYRFSNNEPSFNAYAPVYRGGEKPDFSESFEKKMEKLLGVVYITLRINSVLRESVYQQKPEEASVLMDLFQLNDEKDLILIASTYNSLDESEHYKINSDIFLNQKNRLTQVYPLFIFGRAYILSVEPGRGFYTNHQTRMAWTSSFIGLLLTTIVVFISLFITRRKNYLESELKLRTEALQFNNQRLEELNEHFTNLAAQSRTVLWEVDSDGLITYVSGLAKTVLGYKPSNLINKKFIWEILPAERAERFRRYVIEVFIRKTDFTNHEEIILTADNHTVWMTVNGFPIFNKFNQLTGYRGSFTDITERKKSIEAEILLRQREEQRILLDNIQTQIWYLTDYQTYGAVNKAHAEFLGVNASHIMFRNIYDTIPKEMADAFCKGNMQVFRTGKPISIEVWVPHVSGKRLISISKYPKTNDQEQVEYVVCSAEDITEQKKAEEALKITTERYKSLAENAFEGIYLMHGRNFEYVNEKFCEITGYLRNELTAESFDFSETLTQKGREIVEKRYLARLKGEKLPSIYEFELLTKQGVVKQVEISTTPLSSKDKPRVLGILRDITERKHALQLEQEVAVARKSAQFKQNFLANMSHEIRTPLTGVLGMTEMLSKTSLDQQQKEFVNILHQSGENLKEIINLILDYSKIEAGKVSLNKVVFSPRQLLENAEKLYSSVCNPKVKLKTHVDSNVPGQISADRQRLNQIIGNLLSNAIKFTDSGSINLRIIPDNSIPAKKLEQDFVLLRIEVEDTGIGIRPEIKEKLFLPFYQADQDAIHKNEGTGLGLAICKELTTLMGGEIGAITQEGSGSTFWFNFKAHIPEPDNTDVNTGNYSVKGVGSRSLNILLVEDKMVNQKVISLMLKSLGHLVSMAENGEQALKNFVPGQFDIVLMDIKMPVMDGITATLKLKEQYSDLPPIIGLSASSFEGDREKYMYAGLDEYLTKPFNVEEFKNIVQKFDLNKSIIQ